MTETQSVPASTGGFWETHDVVSKEAFVKSGETFFIVGVEGDIPTQVGPKWRVTVRNGRGTEGTIMFGMEVEDRSETLFAMQKWLATNKGKAIPARLSRAGSKDSLIPA